MRPIKFRGKAMLTAERMEEFEIPHENRWVCGYLIDNYMTGEVVDADDGFIAPEWWAKVVPETVGQYTGLKDKNGKEIYEGDICRYYHHKTSLVRVDKIDLNHQVYYEDDDIGRNFPMQYAETGKTIRYKAVKPVSIDCICGVDMGLPYLHHWFSHKDDNQLTRIEVIGNAHDNPELLER